MSVYDSIGRHYARHRCADPRIVDETVRLLMLEPVSRIADIGAGTGNYSVALAELGFRIKAIEPSGVMREQGRRHPNVEWVAGSAEDIPLPDQSVDGVVCVCSFHHFDDPVKAVREMARMCPGGPIVLFTYDPRLENTPWLAGYFPTMWKDAYDKFPPLKAVEQLLETETGMTVESCVFELPHDLRDRFTQAGWRRPEMYLDETFRAAMSSFALADQNMVKEGIRRLTQDLTTGEWEERHGWLKQLERADMGYRFVRAARQ